MARVFLGMGSNLGDRAANLRRVRQSLAALPTTRWLRMSPIYETDPVGGPPDQGRFLNAVAEIQTVLEPDALLERMWSIERSTGRPAVASRSRWGPRSLDLDILLYDDRVVDGARLTIPHPRLHERWFVLRPLADLAPDLVHPVLNRTIFDLLESLGSPMNTLLVNEIFHSIQGESTWAGRPCVFVRLTGCHLRCGYCDTEYAFHEGRRWSIDEILAEVNRLGGGEGRGDLVEVTGGEPLLQPHVHDLMRRLCDSGKTVLLETSGACDLGRCDPRVIRIMDLKTPGSGEVERNLWANLDLLTPRDEVKFVLCSREDYEWARRLVHRHDLQRKVGAVLFSPVHEVPLGRELPGCPGLGIRELAEWILADHLPVRLQSQLHKLIWDPMARSV